MRPSQILEIGEREKLFMLASIDIQREEEERTSKKIAQNAKRGKSRRR